jgi:predicted phage terminase large subunit-like protein
MTQIDIELDLCKKSFMFFVAYCFLNIYHTKFIFYDFHRNVADILLRLPEEKRIIINAPPRIGKTELVKHYIAWRFLNDPSSTVIYCSYDQSLVSRKNREIMDLLIWVSKHFDIPELMPLSQAKGKTEWVNHANGSILARGTNNAVTGAGCHTLLVLDDPNKPSDRSSATILTKRNTIFKSTIRNRINTPDCPILIIQQRVAAEDLTGFLLTDTSEKWIQYKFSAINEKGESICPERLPVEEIDKYKNDPFTYNAQYLQVPLDDIGKLFTRDSLRMAVTRPPVDKMRLVIAVDASAKADIGNDFNTVSVEGYFEGNQNFYILEVINIHADIIALVQTIRDVRVKYGQQVPVLIEAKANGTAAIQILRRETSGIIEISPCKDKVERALQVKYLFDSNNVFFSLRGLVWGEVQSQFLQFPNCKHDDIVDAVIHGLTYLNKFSHIKTSTSQESHRAEQNRRRVQYTPRSYYGNSGYCP